MITFDDFQKIELKTALILGAERVEGSDKLIRLTLDAGDFADAVDGQEPQKRQRQIVAGIGKAYIPEELVEKTIIIVANLEPRALMGHISEGMLLAANSKGPIILIPAGAVPPGVRIT